MYCSTIIPTVGRSSVARAVQSILGQSIPNEDFEVIVVNDSGSPLPFAEWQNWDHVQIINTNRRERSVARNTGAAMAKGNYLHFLDDDDWVFPGAYQYLYELSQDSNAKWLYGMTQLADRLDRPSIRLRHNLQGNSFAQVMAGEWIPLQSSWIERRTFLRFGGFNPHLAGPEDIDLLRRVLLEEDIAETPNMIAQVIMAGEGSTTNYARHPQASRWARENTINATGFHQRMLSSANATAWKGRMLRIYLTSAVWNLGHQKFFTAVSRLGWSMLTMIQSGKGLLSTGFWQAVRKPYESITFEKGFQEVQKAK